MARIRSIKPEFWTDRSLARRLSRDARMLYLGLWNLADEHARLNGDAYYIKGQIFPYDDDLTPGAIDNLLDELDAAGKAIRYTDGGDPYLLLPTLARHQRLEADKVPSKLPAPPDLNTPIPPQPPEPKNPQATDLEPRGADSSEPGADESAPGADELSLLYVAGSMEHVAGSMEHVPPRTDTFQPPLLALVEAAPIEPAKPTFEEFYDTYPRRVGPAKARTAYEAKVKNGADPNAIVAAARSFGDRCRLLKVDKQFIPYPTTWLNRESWQDDLDESMPTPAVRPAQQRESTTDRAVASGDDALAEFRRITGRHSA